MSEVLDRSSCMLMLQIKQYAVYVVLYSHNNNEGNNFQHLISQTNHRLFNKEEKSNFAEILRKYDVKGPQVNS